jgi:hypothetical protein
MRDIDYAYVNPLVAVSPGVVLAGEQITMIELLAMPTILSGVEVGLRS